MKQKSFRRTLFRSMFSLGVMVLMALALRTSIATVHALPASALPICDFINGSANQPNNTILQYSVGWSKTVATNNANCVINDPTHYPRTNGINAGQTNQVSNPTTQDFLCGWGQAWLYSNPVQGAPWNYGIYNLNNQLYCFKNLHVGRVDVVSVRDVNGNTLSSSQHIQVGQTIMVRLDPLVSGTGVSADQQGPYINLAQNSYQNNWPVTNTTDSKFVHCPGSGAAPACSGVDTNSALTWQTAFPFYQSAASATSSAGVPTNSGAGEQNLLNITPGLGWAPQGIVDLGNCCSAPSAALDSYGYLFKAQQPGNLTLSISDPGGVSMGVYGGPFGTGYVIPASGYTGTYGSYTSVDYGVYFSTKAITYNSVPVSNVSIPVDQPVNQPPAAPVVNCNPNAVINGQNSTVTFSATDPNGDQVRYDVDPNYNGSTFNPSVSVPASGFVGSGVQQSIALQWATGGVKQVAVRAQDSHYATSGLGTCTVTVTYVPPPANPNMQFATDPGATTFTDNAVHYNLSQDAWGANGAGITVPAQYVGSTSYQSCVIRPYPLSGRGISPYTTTTSTWDTWPVIPSSSTYGPIPAANTLQIKGISASVPAVGTVLDEYFAFGCGSNTQTSQGQFSGSPDIQEILITITSPQIPAAQVSLQVTDSGNTGGSYVNAPQSSPYIFSEKISNTGAYTTTSNLELKWQTSYVTNCTFSRTDAGNLQGTFNSSQNWNGGTTGSLLNSNDQGSMQFTGGQVQPTVTIGYTVSCTGSYGSASSTAYVVYQRTSAVIVPSGIAGTVFNDVGGVLGVQDSGEAGIANQTISLVINNYTGGPYSATTTTNASGAYSFNFTPTSSMLQTGLMTITQTTPLPNGWVFTAPLTGVYTNYAVPPALNNGTGYTFNFAERNTAAAYSTFTGQIYNDSNGDGILTTGEKGIAGQLVQLSRITTFTSGSPTTEVLESITTDANGTDSISSFVPPPPNGALSVVYKIAEPNLPGPGWQYTLPVGGVATFTAAPNTIYHQDFGNVSPITIQGVVYNDVSGAGISAGQPRIAGVTIQILDITTNSLASMYNLSTGSSTPVTSVNTAADGSYSVALSAASQGHVIQVRQSTRSGSYPYCTNPAEGTAPAPDNNKYCEYAPELAGPYTGASGAVILTRDFGNSTTANSAVTVVSGRVYEDKDGVSGFNPAYDNPLGAVTVQILDTSGNVLGTASPTDASGYYSYSIAKFSPGYNALLGKRIVIKELTPTGYTAVSPVGGAYPPTQFNGGSLVNYDFVDSTGGGGGGNGPPDTSIFCSLD